MEATTSNTFDSAGAAAALRGAGYRVTPQRLVIHRTLVELGRHVGAEELLAAVGHRLPNVSLPTVYSADGSLAAHFEFTVAVTEDGPRILTPWHEE